HALFRKAIVRYSDQGKNVFCKAANATSARDFVEAILRAQVELYTDPSLPPGCFFIQSAMAGGTSLPARRATLIQRQKNEQAFRLQMESFKKPGEFPPGFTVADITAYVVSVANGMAIRAADGARREDLVRIVDVAMSFWPAKKRRPKK